MKTRFHPRRFWPAVVLVLAALCPLRSQESWTPAFSPTTQNLWQVSHGGGQFVAVGEGGTILTSPDGAAWTSRVSGHSLWLVAVGHGNGLHVVVGDRGTILTSTDGVAWTSRTSGTTARLNGVAYGGGRWLIVAESGELLTSTDAIVWTKLAPSTDRLRGLTFAYGQFVITGDNGLMRVTIDTTDYDTRVLPEGLFVEAVTYARRGFVAVGEDGYIIASDDATTWRRVASNTTAYLRGVAFFNGHFIAAGSNGAVLTSATAAGPWVARSTGTTATLTAATASDAAAIIVGFGGVILRSAPAVSPPIISAQPTAANAVAGDNVLFSVTATGTLPLAYQWRLNGTPLPGQTADRLFLPNVDPAQAGAYSVSVANAQGVVTSAAAALAFVASTAPGPIVDPTFAPTLTFSGNITTVLEQPDGKLLVGGSQFFVTPGVSPFALARLNSDGSVDTAFNTNGSFGGNASITSLALQSDGRLIVGGNFTAPGGTLQPRLVRLNADGSLDLSLSSPASAFPAVPLEHSVQSDGRIVYVSDNRLRRLLPDGAPDTGFVEQLANIPVYRHALLPDGKIVVVAFSGTAALGSSYVVRRLNSDGTPDNTFQIHPLPLSGVTSVRFAPVVVFAGKIHVSYSLPFSRISSGAVILRLNPDGTPDTSWQNPSLFSTIIDSASDLVYAIDATGRIYQAQSFSLPSRENVRVFRRLNPDATLDTSFDVRAGENGTIVGVVPLRDGRVVAFGTFSTFDTVSRPRIVRLVGANAVARAAPIIVAITPEAAAVRPGDTVTLSVTAAGAGPVRYAWNSVVPASERERATVRVPAVVSGVYTAIVTVTNGVGSVTSVPVRIVVAPAAPVILAQPVAVTVSSGRTATLTVEAGGSAPFTYQWFRGTTLVGNGSALTISNFTAADSGDYSVVVRNSLGATTSSIARLTVDGTPQLVNISTRATAGTGDRALIAGFVIRGAATKNVVVRGLGPALASFGVPGTLLNPVLTLNDGAGRVVATNDNWSTTATPPALFASLGAFALANGSADAALQTSLSAGSYTATVSDSANRTGTALVEIYEADSNSTRLVNLSTRAFVDLGSGIGIAGIVVRGQQPGRYLIRGVGPALTTFGVGGALADPVLVLTTSLGVTVASNDNWSTNTNAGELANAAAAVGAFPLPANSRDAALLVTLAPGSYTALVSGAANTTGVALVEVYEVP